MVCRFLVVASFVVWMTQGSVANDDLFKNEVAPVLAARCASCHNSTESKGDFSVHDARSFFKNGFVEIGDSEASYLLELIRSSDGNRPAMPKSGSPLSESQIQSIKKWIDAGARWPDGFEIEPEESISFDWWSFHPIDRPAIPIFADPIATDWIRTPVDAFVLNKLRAHGLGPSVPADRRTLMRRVFYDLTGLPPTFEEIQSFEKDPDPQAYEKLVDRLLASPRYGEHWARHWLDVVKYADTCGYDKDKLRPNAWPYRDYVIRSFNNDKPYKQFVQEQIAGDILYPDSPDGILGLGFIAAGPWDFIGHVEVPESKIDGRVARNLDRDDMVSSTFNTFCSITVQCARCHDHKFDPITQEHYYSLQSIFAAIDRADRVYDEDPHSRIQRSEMSEQINRLEQQLGAINDNLKALGGQELKKIEAEIKTARSMASEQKPQFGYHSRIENSPDVEKWVSVTLPKATTVEQIVLRPSHDDFAGIGSGFGFPLRFKVIVDGDIVFDRTAEDLENPGLGPVSIPLKVVAKQITVVATKLAERQDDYIFALAELQMIDESGNNVALGAEVGALDSIEMPERWRRSNLVDGIWFTGTSENQSVESLEEKRIEFIRQLIGSEAIAHQADLEQQVAALTTGLLQLPAGKMVYAAATEFPSEGSFRPTHGQPREIRLLLRGNVSTPDKPVKPGVIPLHENDDWLLSLNSAAQEGERRAALARWLTADSHPFVWRSIVNRIWQYHFGRGIVESPNDFGRMGTLPSHSELLDWLAVEFRDQGGSFKHLHRMIVTSSVYRQASSYSQTAAETDSNNRYLWRMNRRRLSAEEIRDTKLLASGALDLKMGGPGYYQFELSKTEHSPHYEYHQFNHADPETHRRSIYRFAVRSQPDPYMTTLDCADSSQSTPQRNETQTALQSLTLMNNPFSLAMSEKLAARIRDSTDSIDDQITQASRLTIGRDLSEGERPLMRAYIEKHGLENLARIMFNLSEFLYVD